MAMSLQGAYDRLYDDFLAIEGIKRVFIDTPEVAPAQADLPCIVMAMRQPNVNANGEPGLMEYAYHFDILLLHTGAGVGRLEEIDKAIRPYYQRLIEALAADTSGAGAWTDWNKDEGGSSMTGGVRNPITYNGAGYLGIVWALDIYQRIETTMSAGA